MANGQARFRGAWPLLFLMTIAPPRAASAATLVHSTPLDFEGARVEGLRRLPFAEGLFAGAGLLESPVLRTPRPFDDVVGSWNAEVPKGAAVELSVQVQADGAWSAWYDLGRWDEAGGRSLGEQADAMGRVDIDTLRLRRKATALRYRLRLAGKGRAVPRLHRVALAWIDSSQEPASTPFAPGPWVRALDVPLRSQGEEQEKYRHDICSPTSLAMTLQFWGKSLDTVAVAEGVRDRATRLFGNWPLNVAFAGLHGLRGHVARLEGLDALEREIALGRPVVCSITYGDGELTGSPIRKTKGHLLVVVGFTPEGDVIVNDPAGKPRAEVRRVYKRTEFERAWLGRKRGLAYVLGGRFPEELVVGVPVADLREEPRAPKAPLRHDPALRSQLLFGERVRALEAKGDWARVEALEQPQLTAGRWAGYGGWVSAAALRTPRRAPEANATVRTKRARLALEGGGELVVSIGTRLAVESESGDAALVRLPDGRFATAAAADLRRLGAPADRAAIVAAARLFLGDAYVWGGRSSLQPEPAWGVDCSGLTHLSYRVEGVDLPRDAREQFLRAERVARRDLQPGDLVFLARPGSDEDINHVMLYAGGEGLVESRQGTARVLETTFQERFGKPLSGVESGARVTDLSGRKPAERRLYFGRYLR